MNPVTAVGYAIKQPSPSRTSGEWDTNRYHHCIRIYTHPSSQHVTSYLDTRGGLLVLTPQFSLDGEGPKEVFMEKYYVQNNNKNYKGKSNIAPLSKS
eukprot:scaffold43094_cov67-Attheya_sp.AAC.2